MNILSADPTKAMNELGWKAEFGIEEMCRDSYNFIVNLKKQTIKSIFFEV